MKMENTNYIFLLIAFSAVKVSEGLGCFPINQPQVISIKTGSSFYHDCHCANASIPVEKLKWLDPHGMEIQLQGPGTEPRVYIERQNRSVSLHIQKISKTSSGMYMCQATVNGRVYIDTFIIEAYDPLYFVATKQNQNLIKGKNSLIHCHARGESAPLITWYKKLDEPIPLLDEDKYQKVPEGLIVKNVDDDDNGTYKCRATVLDTSEDAERSIEVTVQRLPVIIEVAGTPNNTVIVGDQLSIECVATGLPHPQYHWSKKTDKVTIETWKSDLNKITFDSVKPSDRGTYECKAFNEAGFSTKEVFIEVLEPAVIKEFSNVTAAEGSTAQIICKAYGRPAPTITIIPKKNDTGDPRIIDDIRKTSNVESMYIKTFTSVNRTHEDIYSCIADNDVDSVSESIELKVLYKPFFKNESETVWGWSGRTVKLHCDHESNPRANVTWRFLGNNLATSEQVEMSRLLIPEKNQHLEYLNIDVAAGRPIYGEYQCQASNELGDANKTVLLQEGFVPSTISDLQIKELTSSSVTFSIIKPISARPSLPIIGFTAEYDEAKNFEITTIHKNRTWSIDRPYQVGKLTPNTSYCIRFAAINEVGSGDWGGYLQFTTLEKTIPKLPEWIEDTKTDSIEESDLTLRWKPAAVDEDVDYYIVRHCPMYEENVIHDLCKEDVVKSENSISLDYLNVNTTYIIELVAHNYRGNSSTAELLITTSGIRKPLAQPLSAAAIIAVSVVVVVLCILAVDLVLFCWRRQGLIATCYYRKNKKAKEDGTLSRDRKGLLRDNSNPSTMEHTLKKDHGHKEFEYNKTTGVITGKHSSV